jgi:hypothetical protein
MAHCPEPSQPLEPAWEHRLSSRKLARFLRSSKPGAVRPLASIHEDIPPKRMASAGLRMNRVWRPQFPVLRRQQAKHPAKF